MFKKLKIAAAAVCALALAATLYVMVFVETARVEVRETDYKAGNYPSSHPILRIVAISDLYVGSLNIDMVKLDEIVRSINALKPDLVLLLGNYINSWSVLGAHINPNRISESLGKITATYGVFAMFGADDVFRGGDIVRQAFKRSNIKLLDDAASKIDMGQKRTLTLIGMTDAEFNAEWLPEDGSPYILAGNNPGWIDRLPQNVKDKAVIALAGRTLGGQVAFFNGRPLFLPDDVDGTKNHGMFEISPSSHIYVTSGIGTKTWPVRWNVPAEIAVVNLIPGGN